MAVNKNMMNKMDKGLLLAHLNEGDKVELTNGKIAEFVRLKQKNFVGTINGSSYNIPIEMFVDVVEKVDLAAKTKEQEMEYSTLMKDELFYINRKGDALIFKFKEIKNNKIIGVNPITNVNTKIDTSLYGGKVKNLSWNVEIKIGKGDENHEYK